jgi:hypothetical protein
LRVTLDWASNTELSENCLLGKWSDCELKGFAHFIETHDGQWSVKPEFRSVDYDRKGKMNFPYQDSWYQTCTKAYDSRYRVVS